MRSGDSGHLAVSFFIYLGEEEDLKGKIERKRESRPRNSWQVSVHVAAGLSGSNSLALTQRRNKKIRTQVIKV